MLSEVWCMTVCCSLLYQSLQHSRSTQHTLRCMLRSCPGAVSACVMGIHTAVKGGEVVPCLPLSAKRVQCCIPGTSWFESTWHASRYLRQHCCLQPSMPALHPAALCCCQRWPCRQSTNPSEHAVRHKRVYAGARALANSPETIITAQSPNLQVRTNSQNSSAPSSNPASTHWCGLHVVCMPPNWLRLVASTPTSIPAIVR